MFLVRFCYSWIKKQVNFNDDILTSLLKLLPGSVFSQLIMLLSLPLVSRLYAPETFGIFGVYMSFLATLSIISCGKYEDAIVVAKSEKLAKYLLVLSVGLTLIVSLILFFIIFLIITIYDLETWLYFFPLSLFLGAVFRCLICWENRKKGYGLISKAQFIQSLVSVFVTISFAYVYQDNVLGFVLAYFFGLFVSTFYLVLYIKKYIFKDLFRLRYCVFVLKRFKRFPKYGVLSSFIYELYLEIPIIMMGMFFGSYYLGQFMLLKRLFSPLVVLQNVLYKIYYQKTSQLFFKKKQFHHLIKIFFVKSSYFLIFTYAIILTFGEKIILFFLGNDWVFAGKVISFLSLFFLVDFLFVSVSSIFLVKKKNKEQLNLNALFLVLRVSVIYFSNFYKLSFFDMLMAFTLFEVCIRLFSMRYIYIVSK